MKFIKIEIINRLTRWELQHPKRSLSSLNIVACIELAVRDDEQLTCHKYIQYAERDIQAMNREVDEFYKQNDLQYKYFKF
jgi:hypothetical protein